MKFENVSSLLGGCENTEAVINTVVQSALAGDEVFANGMKQAVKVDEVSKFGPFVPEPKRSLSLFRFVSSDSTDVGRMNRSACEAAVNIAAKKIFEVKGKSFSGVNGKEKELIIKGLTERAISSVGNKIAVEYVSVSKQKKFFEGAEVFMGKSEEERSLVLWTKTMRRIGILAGIAVSSLMMTSGAMSKESIPVGVELTQENSAWELLVPSKISFGQEKKSSESFVKVADASGRMSGNWGGVTPRGFSLTDDDSEESPTIKQEQRNKYSEKRPYYNEEEVRKYGMPNLSNLDLGVVPSAPSARFLDVASGVIAMNTNNQNDAGNRLGFMVKAGYECMRAARTGNCRISAYGILMDFKAGVYKASLVDQRNSSRVIDVIEQNGGSIKEDKNSVKTVMNERNKWVEEMRNRPEPVYDEEEDMKDFKKNFEGK